MPDKKLTDKEIVKALECCISSKTKTDCLKLKCPYKGECYGVNMYEVALDLINRQKAEIDKLYRINFDMCVAGGKLLHEKEQIKSEAYKECLEKVKEKSKKSEIVCSGALVATSYLISAKNLNNLLKELVGDSNVKTYF